jgi:hypothetical protein
MKKQLFFLTFTLVSLIGFAQVDTVSVYDIQFVNQATLQACEDTSQYQNKTVYFVAVVAVNGNLSEVASGSITGGSRPFVSVLDTADNGAGGPFRGLDLMGVIDGTSDPTPGFENLVAGDIIGVTATLGAYDGETQATPVSSSAITVLGSMNAPTPVVVSVGDLNDDQRVNILETGEQWEGSYIEVQNVTVVAVNYFSGGSRVSMDVSDANGNLLNLSDRFLAQKLPSHQTVNPQSPSTTGSFVAPPIGTQYTYVRGFVIHSENGCTGNPTGRGYELDPAFSTDYNIGVAPPNIADIERDVVVPGSSDQVTISSNITDFDGTVVSANLLYSYNLTDPVSAFTSVAMTNTSGDKYEASISAQANGTVVRYILEATDDAANTTTSPFTPSAQTTTNVYHYTVRDNGLEIVDIQKTFGGSDLSSFLGASVEFTGYVTASAKNSDIGYIYVQQQGASEFAGINCVGNPDLIALCRGDEVTIEGIVEENFGFTRVGVTKVSKTGNFKILAATAVDPSDANLNHEAYESMLVVAKDPSGGQIYMNNPDAGFGEYEVGTQGASTNMRVLAGRQSGSSFASLHVSLVTDAYYYDNDGQMEVDTVITDANMTMDSISGMYYYSFNSYKLLPRNNEDIYGLNVSLEPSGFVPCVKDTTSSVQNIYNHEFNIFPNPANGVLNIGSIGGESNTFGIEILDVTGKNVYTKISAFPITTLDVSFINKGLYLIELKTKEGQLLKTQKIIIQ